MEYEEQARQVLLRDAPAIIEDKVWRAYGLLRYARTLSFEEAMNLLSGVRLGVGVGLIPGRRHVHAEQAAGLHPAGAPGRGGRSLRRTTPTSRCGGHGSCAKCWNPRWGAADEPRRRPRSNVGYRDERLQLY